MAKQIAPENVVGRDKLIAQMWKAIERSSAVFTAERRIGKTTVLKKMEAEPADGKVVLYADLENRDAVIELLNSLAKDHYVTRDEDGRYRFRFPLIQKWWILAEGLEG